MTHKESSRCSYVDSPTSRDANPFATCWTRPGAIPFHFPDGLDASQLIARLAAQQWCGAIVGPHGSGKSTLLEALKPALRDAGLHVRAITLRDRQRRLPLEFLSRLPHGRIILVIDGFEQLGWLERWRLSRRRRRTDLGLLVTTHSPPRIPTLVHLAPDERLVQQLFAKLTTTLSTPITPADVAASHACHRGNVREVFFDLYDRHERLRHEERLFAAARAQALFRQ
jgi:hypothetical protein